MGVVLQLDRNVVVGTYGVITKSMSRKIRIQVVKVSVVIKYG